MFSNNAVFFANRAIRLVLWNFWFSHYSYHRCLYVLFPILTYIDAVNLCGIVIVIYSGLNHINCPAVCLFLWSFNVPYNLASVFLISHLKILEKSTEEKPYKYEHK